MACSTQTSGSQNGINNNISLNSCSQKQCRLTFDDDPSQQMDNVKANEKKQESQQPNLAGKYLRKQTKQAIQVGIQVEHINRNEFIDDKQIQNKKSVTNINESEKTTQRLVKKRKISSYSSVLKPKTDKSKHQWQVVKCINKSLLQRSRINTEPSYNLHYYQQTDTMAAHKRLSGQLNLSSLSRQYYNLSQQRKTKLKDLYHRKSQLQSRLSNISKQLHNVRQQSVENIRSNRSPIIPVLSTNNPQNKIMRHTRKKSYQVRTSNNLSVMKRNTRKIPKIQYNHYEQSELQKSLLAVKFVQRVSKESRERRARMIANNSKKLLQKLREVSIDCSHGKCEFQAKKQMLHNSRVSS